MQHDSATPFIKEYRSLTSRQAPPNLTSDHTIDNAANSHGTYYLLQITQHFQATNKKDPPRLVDVYRLQLEF
jgi:hypothetical protein